MNHEPLGFLIGTFKWSQQRWATVNEEGFPVVSTFERSEYFLWNRVHTCTDHRNLAYIFLTGDWRAVLCEKTAQRLEQWK